MSLFPVSSLRLLLIVMSNAANVKYRCAATDIIEQIIEITSPAPLVSVDTPVYED